MDASALHPSKSTQDLIQASRPGFPQGLRVRSLARFRPRRRVRRAKTDRRGPVSTAFLEVIPPRMRKTIPTSLATLTLAAPTTQVLYVMKETALHAPAKKLLEDIGYKGASSRHRAPDPARTSVPDSASRTRSPRPSGRFSRRGGGFSARARHRAATEPRDGKPPRGPDGTPRVPTRAPRAVARVPATTHTVAHPPPRGLPSSYPVVSPATWRFRDIRDDVVYFFFIRGLDGAPRPSSSIVHLHVRPSRTFPPVPHLTSLPPPSRPQSPPPRPSIRASASSSPPPLTRLRRLTSRLSRGNRRSRSSTRPRRPPPPPPARPPPPRRPPPPMPPSPRASRGSRRTWRLSSCTRRRTCRPRRT